MKESDTKGKGREQSDTVFQEEIQQQKTKERDNNQLAMIFIEV